FDRLDRGISDFLWRIGVPLVRIGLGVVFVWFGALKLTGTSPALELVTKTVYWFNPVIFVPVLGWWEIAIGVCLATPALTRIGIFLMAAQMPGTFLPLILLPQVCFQDHWWNLTLEGQYIVKNLVLLGSGFVLGGLVHGRRQSD